MPKIQRQLGTLIVIVLALVFAFASRQNGTVDVATDSASRQAPAAATSMPRPWAAPAGTTRAPQSHTLPTIAFEDLPREAQETIELIQQNGPFPYEQDGSTFRNREGLLPPQPNGYYREYTVTTPGSDDRGARRIVGGRNGELYYTDDHYESFSRIR